MIKFANLSKSFRRQKVLQDINLDIDRGHHIALVGSNGAGKTTLIRCLLGEYTCDGQVSVDGVEPRAHRRQVLSMVGFVPQLPPPIKVPVGQLIRFCASVCGVEEHAIYTVAEQLGFNAEAFRHHPFVKLSGGQKQKLLIAIALGRDTKLLILDEPAANLDPDARSILFQLLAKKQSDSVMIITSHRLDEVAPLVNRVIELDRGEVVLDDRVADLVELSSWLDCSVVLLATDQAFSEAIGAWGFTSSDGGKSWSGRVAGPERLRFLGVISRYAALLAHLRIDDLAASGDTYGGVVNG